MKRDGVWCCQSPDLITILSLLLKHRGAFSLQEFLHAISFAFELRLLEGGYMLGELRLMRARMRHKQIARQVPVRPGLVCCCVPTAVGRDVAILVAIHDKRFTIRKDYFACGVCVCRREGSG